VRSAVWVLDPTSGPGTAETIVLGLRERGLVADAHEFAGETVVIVRDPPDDLEPPAEVARASGYDVPLKGGLTRRTLIDRCAMALALSVGGAAIGVSGLFASPPERRGESLDELEVATLEELRRKQFKTFRFGNEPGIVVLNGDKLHALSLVCTHLGCLVIWSPERRQLVCPCHRAAFDLGGNVLRGPPPRPLRSFEASLQDGRVLVRRPGRVG